MSEDVSFKVIVLFYAVVFTFFLALSFVYPIVSRYAVYLGADPRTVGLIWSILFAVTFVLRPVFGLISDKGYRLHLLYTGLVAVILSMLSFYTANNVSGLFLARILQGIGVAAFIPSSIALTADLAPPQSVGTFMGWRSLTIGLTDVFGPSTSGRIVDVMGYKPVFLLSLVVTIIALIMLSFIAVALSTHARKQISRSIGTRTNWSRILMSMTVFALNASSYALVVSFLPAHYEEIGLPATIFGLFVSVQGLSSLIARVYGGVLSDRMGEELTATMGLFFGFIGRLILAYNPYPPLIYVSGVFSGIGLGFTIPSLQTLALRNTPSHRRGFASAIFAWGFDLGNLIAPVLTISIVGGYLAAVRVSPLPVGIGLLVISSYAYYRRRMNTER